MNRYAQEIIQSFGTQQNKENLKLRIIKLYSDSNNANDALVVNKFLNENINDLMTNYKEYITQELLVSDPLPGSDANDQVCCYNRGFIENTVQFISDHVISRVEQVPVYGVTDLVPTSRFKNNYQQSADKILDSWDKNAARNIQMRDDSSAYYTPTWGTNDCNWTINGRSHYDEYYDNRNNYHRSGDTREHTQTYNCVTNCTNNYINNAANCGISDSNNTNCAEKYTSIPSGYQNMLPQTLNTGITFSDQRDLNTSNHVVQYENAAYKAILNGRNDNHTAYALGVSNITTDSRLLQRNIFRRANGVENGIDHRESRLYARNLDTDITEGLRGAEHGYKQRGYDMSGLVQKTNHINTARERYSPNCRNRGDMKLYDTHQIPIDPRYQ